MYVIGVQLDIVWENKAANFEKVRALLDRAHPAAGSLVVLPEMFSTGFSMNVEAITDTPSNEATGFLSKVAADYRVHVLGGVTTTAPDGRGLNQAVFYGPDGRAMGRYSKIHPFSFAGEHEHYAPGDAVVRFACGPFVLCPFVCYDLRFPEVFRHAAKRGANLYAVIANWPASRQAHWLALLEARAIENQAYVVAVNRSGRDPNHAYSGRSLVIDPRGNVIVDAGTREGTIGARLDLPELLAYRNRFPALADMRDAYVK